SLLSVLRRPGHRHLHSSPTRRSSDLWMHPTRSIRAQVLSIRERSYVSVARANGEGELGILFREVMPNLVPYIAASFVGAVSGAIDRKSTRLNSSHGSISYAVFCLKKK